MFARKFIFFIIFWFVNIIQLKKLCMKYKGERSYLTNFNWNFYVIFHFISFMFYNRKGLIQRNEQNSISIGHHHHHHHRHNNDGSNRIFESNQQIKDEDNFNKGMQNGHYLFVYIFTIIIIMKWKKNSAISQCSL